MFYTIIALIIRLFLAFQLWPEGKLALKPHTRSSSSVFLFVATAAIVLGFYVYFVTLVLLFYLGVRMWKNWRGFKLNRDTVAFLLALLLFFQGPGAISLDKLVGNI